MTWSFCICQWIHPNLNQPFKQDHQMFNLIGELYNKNSTSTVAPYFWSFGAWTLGAQHVAAHEKMSSSPVGSKSLRPGSSWDTLESETVKTIWNYIHMGVSKNRGTPKWMVYNGKPFWNGWFGGTTIFGNIHIYVYLFCSWQGQYGAMVCYG